MQKNSSEFNLPLVEKGKTNGVGCFGGGVAEAGTVGVFASFPGVSQECFPGIKGVGGWALAFKLVGRTLPGNRFAV